MTNRAEILPAWPAKMSDATVALYLDVSRSTVWKLSAEGTIPPPERVPGLRSARWDKAALDDAIAKWGD